MKLGTHMQGHNTDTPAKIQGHSSNITPFTPHMCDIPGHLSQNLNIAIHTYVHFRI